VLREARHILIAHSAVDPNPYTARLRDLGFRFTLIKKCPTVVDRACFDRTIDHDYQEDVEATFGLAEHLHGEDPPKVSPWVQAWRRSAATASSASSRSAVTTEG
jgi:hypothetical protein